MTDPINVILWDSGHWRGQGGFSRPRILSAVRNLEMTGQLCISEIRYVKTDTELSKRLPKEPPRAHHIREEKRHEVQRLRVKRTAVSLGSPPCLGSAPREENLEPREENLETETLHPIPADKKLLLIVVMPPGDERTRLITKLLRLDIEASLVIAPAVWTNSVELEIVIAETRNPTRVVPVPFVPYRFSEAMRALSDLKQNEGKVLELLQASVLSGKYARYGKIGFFSFLSEFASPVIDCTLSAAESPIASGSIIYKETQVGRCPCILINAVHKNGVVSVLNLSAIAQFQTVNLECTAFFSGTRLNFTDAFRSSVLYDADGSVKSSESSRGHDTGVENRNGYAKLLSNIINNKDLPPLSSYRNTQAFIDQVYKSLLDMRTENTFQSHFTLG